MKSFKEYLKEQPEEQVSTTNTGIEIFFNNLTENVQKKIMASLIKAINTPEGEQQ